MMCLILMITIAFLGLYYLSLPKEEYRYVEDGIAYFVYPHYEKIKMVRKCLLSTVFTIKTRRSKNISIHTLS